MDINTKTTEDIFCYKFRVMYKIDFFFFMERNGKKQTWQKKADMFQDSNKTTPTTQNDKQWVFIFIVIRTVVQVSTISYKQ